MLKGFIVGLALTIIIGQVPKLFGVDGGDGDFFQKAWATIGNLGETSGVTILVGGLSLALVLALKRCLPAVPASLVAVAGGIAAVHIFNLDSHGLEIVGHVDSGLPSLGGPGLSLHEYGRLAAGGIGVMLVGFAEGLGAAKTYAEKDHYEIDPNRELLGLGGANLAAGLSGGMVVNGSLSKTAVNVAAGAKHAALRPLGRGADDPHPALPHRPLRRAAGGDPGGDRDRRGGRAGRLPGPARASTASTRGSSAAISASPRGRTSSPRWRRCSASSSSTPCPASSSASASR